MTIDQIQALLIWSAAINYAILILWFTVFVFAHDSLYRMHSRWFRLSGEMFDAFNYAGIAIYKIGIMLFVVVPLLALLFVRGGA